MKKPDRFCITASNAYLRNHVNDETCGEVWIKETSAMLRRQHAAYVRMVKKLMLERRYSHTIHNGALDDVLAAFVLYKRGER